MCEPNEVAAFDGAGFVVAPAGFGKTHLIASSTALSAGRQLILTHTYAGVNSLYRKMQTLGVNPKQYRIDTIASWSLRLCLAYRETSGWASERPADNEWGALYRSCAVMLDHAFVRRIVRASYSGMFVDEYQDCSIDQHEIVLRLSRDLPCRVMGDPLQGIFDFDGQNPVDWARDVQGNFEPLGRLEVPHRWLRAEAPELGEWLRAARERLEQGRPLDLNANRPASVHLVRNAALPALLHIGQATACRNVRAAAGQTIVAIHKGDGEHKTKCHALSRNLGGLYSSIEEVEGKSVFSFINEITGAARPRTRLKKVIGFAERCMTGVRVAVPAGTQRGEQVAIRANTRNPEIARLANAYLEDGHSSSLRALLKEIRRTPNVDLIRADLFNRVLGVLQTQILNPQMTLRDAGDQYQREFRHKGRPVGHRRLIGTTLLVKGLEYDHAIVLEATSLSRKDLYVALTRGARSLTIVTSNTVVNPLA
jgi:hypothetical protein